GVFHDAAEDVDFAFLHADLGFYLALADDGLADAADVLVGVHVRDVHGQLERDLVQPVHVRCDVDVDANVDVVELGVDQRVDADAADAGLERTGRDRHPLTDLQ